MATINHNNVQEYIKQGLIDPTKIKIDLNTNKTTSDPNHKWITLDSAIKQGLHFNFDYDVKELDTPKVTDLDEIIVTAPKKKKMFATGAGEMKPFNNEFEANNYIKSHPKKDASENIFNYAMVPGIGLIRQFGITPIIKGISNASKYLSANGWLQATNTTNTTPYWLNPQTATMIDASLAGSATGASLYDLYKNGPTVGNVIGTTAGLGGLAFEAYPTIKEGLSFVNNNFRKPYLIARSINKSEFIPEYEAYLENKNLWDIGTYDEYKNYLTSIFPESKYPLIVYHGGPKGIQKFRTPDSKLLNKNINTGTKDYGIYFTDNKELAKYYARSHKKGTSQVYKVKLNLPSVIRYDNPAFSQSFVRTDKLRFSPDAISKYWYDRLNLSKYNGIIQNKSGSVYSRGQITMFDPEDIHILGSNKDILKFIEWKKNPRILENLSYNSNMIYNMPTQYDVTFKNITSFIGGHVPIISFGATTAGGGGYLLYEYIKRNNQE